jgi:lactobin A/cerein 7B family class IIb bacteriocin
MLSKKAQQIIWRLTMKELSLNEVESVSGGILPLAAAIAVAVARKVAIKQVRKYATKKNAAIAAGAAAGWAAED